MTLKAGTIKYAAGKEFPNKFKPGEMQQNLVAVMEDGTEEKIYFSAGRVPHSTLRQGDPINILYEEFNGRTIRKLYSSVTNNDRNNNVPTSNTSVNHSSSRVSASPVEVINQQINAYIYTFKQVQDNFNSSGYPDLSVEDIRTIATSIMIKLDRANVDLSQLPDVLVEEIDGEPAF